MLVVRKSCIVVIIPYFWTTAQCSTELRSNSAKILLISNFSNRGYDFSVRSWNQHANKKNKDFTCSVKTKISGDVFIAERTNLHWAQTLGNI